MGEVASLDHEVLDDSVKTGAFVREQLSLTALSLFSWKSRVMSLNDHTARVGYVIFRSEL